MKNNFYFAASYDCGAYGAGTYQNGSCSGATSTTTGGANGTLTNTGLDIAVVVTLSCLILLAAVLVRFWRRPAKKLSAQ